MTDINLTFEQLPMEVARQGKILDEIVKILSFPPDLKLLNVSESDKMITLKEACEFLNLSQPTLYRKVSNREIPHSKRGRKLYFSTKELSQYLQKGKRKTLEEIQEEADQFKEKRR